MAKTHLRLPSSIRGASRRASSAPSVNSWTHTARTAFTQLNTIVSMITSTGLLVAILWLVGRYYAVGYFGAMHIPLFQLSFSVWDYVVQGLTPTWVGVVAGIILIGGLIASIVWTWGS